MVRVEVHSLTALMVILSGVVLATGCATAQPPPIYRAAPCKVAPRVDGLDGSGEWQSATRVEIALGMTAATGGERPTRRAELRLMSSAKNLYVAFRVPD